MWSAGPAPRLPLGGRSQLLRPGFFLARGQRIGLFGGSFDPAHDGHAHVAETARRRLGLDRIIWLVSPQNPLKPRSAELKQRMASAARFARGPSMIVSDVETKIGSAYTIDTLRALKARFPGVRFVWLMGADNLAQFHRWRGWRKIAALVPIAVVARPRYDGPAHAARAMGWLRRFVRPAGQAAQWTRWRLPALVHLKLPPDPTSSTALRSSDPHWHLSPHLSLNRKGSRDGVTRRPLA